jgi:hypothetical protein
MVLLIRLASSPVTQREDRASKQDESPNDCQLQRAWNAHKDQDVTDKRYQQNAQQCPYNRS